MQKLHEERAVLGAKQPSFGEGGSDRDRALRPQTEPVPRAGGSGGQYKEICLWRRPASSRSGSLLPGSGVFARQKSR